MRVKSSGLQYYVDRIAGGRPYSFVRFGDGEWVAGISHSRGRTSSGSQRLDIPELQRDMRRAFVSCHVADNYIPSLRPSSLNRRVEEWLERNVPEGVQWHDCRVFYLSSAHGKLFPLIEVLRNLTIPLVFVGPARLRGLKEREVFPKATFLTIPGRDCYQDKAEIVQQVLDVPRPAFVSFTAGPAAKVMIHELFPVLGGESFLFDLGSLWDVYVGSRTRRYHKEMTAGTVWANLGFGDGIVSRDIAIVIPTLNRIKGEDTGKLALATAGCSVPVRIIVSHDEHRQGFTKTSNAGMRLTRPDEDVCLLNDDIFGFQYGWLEILRRTLYLDPTYGISGPSGKSAAVDTGAPGQVGTQVIAAISFWCVLMKRPMLTALGLLDEAFIHYCSDNWYCVTMRKAGWKCVWAKAVYLKHQHHGSGWHKEWRDHDRAILFERDG